MSPIVRRLKMMYAVTALSGAFLLHQGDHLQTVTAQSNTSQEIQDRIEEKLIDRLDAKQAQIDMHLQTTDTRVNELSDKISVIQGLGEGVLGVLGVLQIWSLVVSLKQGKAAQI